MSFQKLLQIVYTEKANMFFNLNHFSAAFKPVHVHLNQF